MERKESRVCDASAKKKVLPGYTKFEWDYYYQLAKAYYDHYGDLFISSSFKTFNGYEQVEDGICLGTWISWQRKNKLKEKLTKEQIEKLERIEMIWDIHHFKWERNYQLVKSYYEYYGHLNIPSSYKTINGYEQDSEGINIGRWIKDQRMAYVRLSEDRIKKLNDLEMIWDLHEFNWNQKYELAKAYYEYYGHLNIPSSYKTINGYEEDKDGIDIGRWLQEQKTCYDKYLKSAAERVQKLEAIGMIMDLQEVEWNRKYELAKAYYEHYGNLNIVSTYRTINGYEEDKAGVTLGRWIIDQRRCYNKYLKFSKERIRKLDLIGMIWVVRYHWDQGYALAKEYYNDYGSLSINVIDQNIGNEYIIKWFCKQREKYRGKNLVSSVLTDDQIALLDQLEFEWFEDNERLQKERIDSRSLCRKQIEILNRFKTYLNKIQLNGDSFSKEELNQGFIDELAGKQFIKKK